MVFVVVVVGGSGGGNVVESSRVESRWWKTPPAAGGEPMKEAAAEKSAKEIYLPFLYFARDAHFRRTTEESEINEYSGATGAELDCTGWRDEREKKKGRQPWSVRE